MNNEPVKVEAIGNLFVLDRQYIVLTKLHPKEETKWDSFIVTNKNYSQVYKDADGKEWWVYDKPFVLNVSAPCVVEEHIRDIYVKEVFQWVGMH